MEGELSDLVVGVLSDWVEGELLDLGESELVVGWKVRILDWVQG